MCAEQASLGLVFDVKVEPDEIENEELENVQQHVVWQLSLCRVASVVSAK